MDAIPQSGPYFPVAHLVEGPKPTFERHVEHFLSNAPTQPEFEPVQLEFDDEAPAPPFRPRRELYGVVCAAVAACLAILALAALGQ